MAFDWFTLLSTPLPCPAVGLDLTGWIDRGVEQFRLLFPEETFFHQPWNIKALLTLIFVSLCCGAVGSLVVGGKMAFFSDALAHCAFAGVSIGFLVFDLVIIRHYPGANFWLWVTPIMAVFGVLIGVGIVAVRQRTGLANDTVIGVFFAGSIGLAAMLRKLMRERNLFKLEDLLFGDPLTASSLDILALAALTVVTLLFLAWGYNYLLLGSFNASLAISRRTPLRLGNYLFVVLLAVVVNLSLRAVGLLLINALLIVPAATAMNVSRNMRQLFWLTVTLCLGVSIAGQVLSWEVGVHTNIDFGISGPIVFLSVLLFLISMLIGPYVRRRVRPRTPPS